MYVPKGRRDLGRPRKRSAAETGTESTPSYRNEDDLTLCEYVIGVSRIIILCVY